MKYKDAYLRMPLQEMQEFRKQSGIFGLELEVEGRGLPQDMAGTNWNVVGEGSLRNGGLEYVLRKPLPYSDLKAAVGELFTKLRGPDVELQQSSRTSLHVHVNVQKEPIQNIANIFATYLILEPVLLKFCGEEREGNLFCIPVYEGEFVNAAFAEAISNLGTTNFSRGFPENCRYSALNLSALRKFGSIEFRAMRGDVQPEDIGDWVYLISALRKYAKSKANPCEILEDFSYRGPVDFVHNVLKGPADKNKLVEGLEIPEQAVLNGCRMAQEWAFDTEWVNLKEEPRAKKKSSSSRSSDDR